MICVLPSTPTFMHRPFRRWMSNQVEGHPISPSSRSTDSGSPASNTDLPSFLVGCPVVHRLSLGGCLGNGATVDFAQLLLRLERLETGTSSVEADRVLFDQFLDSDALMRLVLGLRVLDFEARKDAVRVFSQVLRLGAVLGAEHELAEHFRSRPGFGAALSEGLGNEELSHHFGIMLQACAQRSEVARLLFREGVLLCLVKFAGECNEQRVEVSLEAFAVLRGMLLAQKEVAAAYLSDIFEGFFATYNRLLQIQNYMVQRQALRLLSDLFLDHSFRNVMVTYAGRHDFLKILMVLLRSNSGALQLEVFHVFKLFVCNPRKPFKVQLIMFRNRDRIAGLLEAMAADSSCTEIAEEARAVARVVAVVAPPQKCAGAD